MAVHSAAPRIWTEEEIELVELIANRCWESIQRAKVTRDLRESEAKAHEASAAKSDFLANMSHEIRTPMNAVIGIANILLATNTDTKNKQLVSTLKTSADQLMTLINDMLDLSRIESGHVELQNDWFNPTELMRDCLSVISVEARRKGLHIFSHEGWPYHINAWGDEQRIRQIVMNLLSNAVKFTTEGRVTVHIRQERITEDCILMISVKDTGIGMSKEAISTVFDKFTQADSSIARKFGGTGLGLSISKSLAKMMRGDISVYSDVGKGSDFILEIPVKTKAVISHTNPNANSVVMERHPAKLLLVDDNATNLFVANKILIDLGYECIIAQSGKEALDKLSSERVDLVLMDVQMPDMDGYEATRQIREKVPNGKNLPIVAMTAHAFNNHREQCIAAGMNDFIAKPFKPDALADAIDRNIKASQL